MANPFFRFKQFTVYHDQCAMKVTTDACLFGAWCAKEVSGMPLEKVLDIGTGTGLLSLMLAQQSHASIDAVEIDKNAAQQAAENFTAAPWTDRLQVIHGDIATVHLKEKYNCIISNPPFYEKELASPDGLRNVAHHSHKLKLEDLLNIINQYLEEDGCFFLLLPYKRKREMDHLLKEQKLQVVKEVLVHQTTRHQPFRVMIKGSRRATDAAESIRLDIGAQDGTYSPAFLSLLKEYYLYL